MLRPLYKLIVYLLFGALKSSLDSLATSEKSWETSLEKVTSWIVIGFGDLSPGNQEQKLPIVRPLQFKHRRRSPEKGYLVKRVSLKPTFFYKR